MATSRSMLESLLARVRQRATEPRQTALPNPPVVIPPLKVPRIEMPVARAGKPAAQARAAVEEDIEEYEDELIEIIEDGDVTSESVPEALPLQLTASAPSLEMRRRVVPPSVTPNDAPKPAPKGVASPARAAASALTPETLRPETVQRRPVAATQVVQKQGARPDLRSTSFIELLDASLELGS
jgi:hypothetical protein